MSDEFSARAQDLSTDDFDGFYRGGTPPWEIGRPQPVLVELFDAGAVTGRVLDVGCGTGEHALLAAQRGLQATGVDSAATAIERARAKAARLGLDVRFEVGNALNLGAVVDGTFDTVIDSALFHVFDDERRAVYVEGLRSVTAPGGRYILLCFSDAVPGAVGPRRVSETEIRETFTDGWHVESVQPAVLETIDVDVAAYRADIRRT